MSLPKPEMCNCQDCGGDGPIFPLPRQGGKVSLTETPWAVHCLNHGKVFLTNHDYNQQMNNANRLWRCPICNEEGAFDDGQYEKYLEEEEPNGE